jgi:ATPase components of various ABC-type transport systems, contain duplicated ATPase
MMKTPAPALMELRAVTKQYRRGGILGRGSAITAVDAVSLRINAGECLALLGKSGSGKSTLGRLVLGLEKPDAGDVLYKGTSLHALRGASRRAARRAVQVVFQNSRGAVNPRFSALEIIGEPLANFDRLTGDALKERVRELLVMVGLSPDDMHKLPHQFSGGELQRVCLSRALAPSPELIVLDEAVSSLDMVSQALVLDLLADIGQRTGTAFLFITHDVRVVCRSADSVAVMEDGALTGVARTLDDIANVAGSALATLAGAVPPAGPEE